MVVGGDQGYISSDSLCVTQGRPHTLYRMLLTLFRVSVAFLSLGLSGRRPGRRFAFSQSGASQQPLQHPLEGWRCGVRGSLRVADEARRRL